MIDYFALTLIHGLLAIVLFRLVQNDALDPEKPPMRVSRNKTKSHQQADQNTAHGRSQRP